MRYLVTAEEMRRYDANTIEKIGIPGMVLMERAALAARDTVLEILEKSAGTRAEKSVGVLVLAGMGNNGGDGLALARLLSEAGVRVTVWCVGEEEKASAQWRQQRHILEHYGVCQVSAPDADAYTVLVDALFGVGLSREITGGYAEAIRRFNALEGYKLALDVPSGVCSDTGKLLGCAVRADETVTFGFGKRGLYLYPGCMYAGSVRVVDIGITERSFGAERPGMFCLVGREDIGSRMPVRQGAGNKGTFGKVLLIAGSAGMAGAAVLSARAAYRVGAGMVKILTDEKNRVILQETVPEALYGTYEDLEESMDWADVIAVGPGLGRSEKAYRVLERAVAGSDKSLLIDADGLNLLAEHMELQSLLADAAALPGQEAQESQTEGRQTRRQVILTPHVGELARLTGLSIAQLKENLWEHGRSLAERLHVTLVAKDARTFTCAENRPVCVNLCGNSGMATAGSGDVLAGILAGIWAQSGGQEDGFDTACLGVHIHAAAGDLAAAAKGEYGCMAGDLAEAAAEVIRASALPLSQEARWENKMPGVMDASNRK